MGRRSSRTKHRRNRRKPGRTSGNHPTTDPVSGDATGSDIDDTHHSHSNSGFSQDEGGIKRKRTTVNSGPTAYGDQVSNHSHEDEGNKRDLVDKIVRLENMLYTVTRVDENDGAQLVPVDPSMGVSRPVKPAVRLWEFGTGYIATLDGQTDYIVMKNNHTWYRVKQGNVRKTGCGFCSKAKPSDSVLEIYVQEVNPFDNDQGVPDPVWMPLAAFQ